VIFGSLSWIKLAHLEKLIRFREASVFACDQHLHHGRAFISTVPKPDMDGPGTHVVIRIR
jgi:hypothetical protein